MAMTMALLWRASAAPRAGVERRAAAGRVSLRTAKGSNCGGADAQDDATDRRKMMMLLQRTHNAASGATSAERGARERVQNERRASAKMDLNSAR